MEILTLLLIITITAISAVTIWMNLPGSFLMLVFILIWAWFGDFVLISLTEIFIIFGLLVLLEILEFALSGLAAKYGGAEKRSAFLAVIGGVLGTIVLGSLFFIVGAILGLLIGSYLGAYWGEHQAGKAPDEARRAALAALMGSIAGKLLKSATTVIIGVWMIQEIL
ncbi:MAG: DUF456 domain-containing protein [Candidatus Marinimicrobia bacterium]|jgi:hypothetical protein|nr:DUF456 domain-containing protein [Candidatus Neomarinimicrobiota bacterium]MBT3574459.1 DUF456 domain-containing protein [Candidatus Neomarinimicrobiota bacterium]MBT3681422.1 DUF456 domain-containing protein [Candidatus Neomarinimicrobiota bacterium]MBT3952186.1 DUF456 domain-containing protein [Candidatus Neomarinimicrobiota bacterium]MBT4253981.1 DUF456 domain-containing protein [Candidatus Neomarinimicrobiota bacterium]